MSSTAYMPGRAINRSAVSAEPRATRVLKRLRRLMGFAILFLPTILAATYFGFIAADRYVSEAQFVVRTASKPVGIGALGSFLQMSGLARTNDDAYAVEGYVGSRDAVQQLLKRLPLREIYGHPDADFMTRYPSLLYGASDEELHRYMSRVVQTSYRNTSGITTLRVEAFRAEDARAVADELLSLSEQTVNRMNERVQSDAIKTSLELVKDFEKRLVDAQIAITRFRNAELMLDPLSSSIVVTEVVGRLTGDRAAVEAQISEMSTAAPNSPSLPALRRRLAALEDAILNERRKISDTGGGLANKLADYERLILEREFAKTGLSSAVKGLEQARAEARRQQLYIEHVVRPNLPDDAMQPRRFAGIWTVLCLNLGGLLLAWLFYSGVKQHGAG